MRQGQAAEFPPGMHRRKRYYKALQGIRDIDELMEQSGKRWVRNIKECNLNEEKEERSGGIVLLEKLLGCVLV